MWGVVFLALILTNLPRLAHGCATFWADGSRTGPLTRALDTMYTTRRARARGLFTVVIAGSSVTRELVTDDWFPEGHVANASLVGGSLFPRTVHALYLIDNAPPDLLLVPLLWHGFGDLANDPVPTPPLTLEWVPHPTDQLVTMGFGFTRLDGGLRQLRQLFWEQWYTARTGGHERDQPDQSEQPFEERYANLPQLLARKPVPSYRSIQRLETVRAYGASRGVTVLYYFSPHNPAFFESRLDPKALIRFRRALGPHVFTDLTGVVPAPRFENSFVHPDTEGMQLVSGALRDALAPYRGRSPSPNVQIPGPLTRFTRGARFMLTSYKFRLRRALRGERTPDQPREIY